MLTSYKNYQNLTDTERASVDKFIPTWQRYLNNVYEFVFEPINHVLSYFEVSNTKNLIADFEAHEAKLAAAAKK